MIRPELRDQFIYKIKLSERDQSNLNRLDVFLRSTLGLTIEEAGILLTTLTYKYLVRDGVK